MDVLDCINQIILFVLGISTLIGILDFVGFLPLKVREWLHLNRSSDTLDVLNKIGVDVNHYQRLIYSFKYPKNKTQAEIEKTVFDSLQKSKINKKVAVGHYVTTLLPYYYDLIGATCNPEAARYYANILSTYWAICLETPGTIKDFQFDFIVTPKGGSPILGYEFAALVQKPFVLHEESQRFEGDDMRKCFDCDAVPKRGSKALIVDDSTTGGTMVCKTVDDLRRFGYQVNTCLVVFEPKGKNAREKLNAKNIQLISIVETHNT